MIAILGTIGTMLSAMIFPWQLTALLALSVAVVEPLVPVAAGVLIDVLYYTSGAGLPWASILGLLATIGAYVVRSRLYVIAFE